MQPWYAAVGPMAAAAEVVTLAEEWGITPTELSLAWSIARPCNASVIIGTTVGRLGIRVIQDLVFHEVVHTPMQ